MNIQDLSQKMVAKVEDAFMAAMKNQTSSGDFTVGIYPIGLLPDLDVLVVERYAEDGWVPNEAHDAKIRATLLEIALRFSRMHYALIEVNGMPLKTWAETPGGAGKSPILVRVVQMVRPAPGDEHLPPVPVAAVATDLLPESVTYRDLKAQIASGVLPPPAYSGAAAATKGSTKLSPAATAELSELLEDAMRNRTSIVAPNTTRIDPKVFLGAETRADATSPWWPTPEDNALIQDRMIDLAVSFSCRGPNEIKIWIDGVDFHHWTRAFNLGPEPITVRVVELPPQSGYPEAYVDPMTAGARTGAPAATTPQHYNLGDIECIDALEAALGPEGFTGFCVGNVIKYCWRHRAKNGLQDLEKAQWYLAKAIEKRSR